jgi:hypothetical protein
MRDAAVAAANRMVPMNTLKEKTVCFFLATEDGEFPALPQRKPDACNSQIFLCRRFRPEKNWKIYELVIPVVTEMGVETILPIRIKGVDSEFSEKLIEQLHQRFETKHIFLKAKP